MDERPRAGGTGVGRMGGGGAARVVRSMTAGPLLEEK